MNTTSTTTQGWHFTNWGTWGWIETIVKGIGIAAGILAFLQSNAAAPLIIGGNPKLGAVIVLALLTFALTGALVMRFGQREVTAFIFGIFNVLGHAGLLIALLREPQNITLGVIFGVAFILGEILRQRFFATSGYTEGGRPTAALMNFSRGFMIAYVLLTVFLNV